MVARPDPPAASRPGFRFRMMAAAPALCWFLASCVSLEFDRMTGTTFPPPQMVNGQPVTLETIYNAAGIKLDVQEDDTAIQPLNIAEDDCISDAELTTVENGHRHLSLFPTSVCPFQFCNTYHLYGVVVNHHGTFGDACAPNAIQVLGKMWQGHTRSAFAIFYQASTIQAGGPEYLRTTAHEIGHAFNLHHSDGDGVSIMTQTGDLEDDPAWAFSDQSREHLESHPAQCKFPGAVGAAPFTWVNNEHAAWFHPDEVLTVTTCE
ncbi:hypothetical protein DNFV4_00144 [Nitrospira tepida]|uniref:Uncharacterized protein n=2 Tax=Nitrospira tepida TaxID=2973512 RepID=A0AA86MVE8_9BACT|nr:hypothetical protein DNFV4_00144 [Nitrospira tepida]